MVWVSLYVHTSIWISLIIDFMLMNLDVIRRHMVICFPILVLYMIVNVSVTLNVHQVYPYFTYTNWETYLIILFSVVLFFLSFELAIGLNKLKEKYDWGPRNRLASENMSLVETPEGEKIN